LLKQLAAQRFVKYWESRRDVFGEEKFTLPMTLSEALRDDVTAIETGMYCLLPEKDLSGRQMIFLEPHRHTGEGYSAESLVRLRCCQVGPVFYLLQTAISQACVNVFCI